MNLPTLFDMNFLFRWCRALYGRHNWTVCQY